MADPLESMRRLEDRIKKSEANQYVTITHEQGRHCIIIGFKHTTPRKIVGDLKSEIIEGKYSGLIFTAFPNYCGRTDILVCIDDPCEDRVEHCYYDEQHPQSD